MLGRLVTTDQIDLLPERRESCGKRVLAVANPVGVHDIAQIGYRDGRVALERGGPSFDVGA
jgi:hypothetical protein